MSDFDDLGTLQVTACQMTDDDVDFHSDMTYCRSLMDEIITDVIILRRRHATPWPIVLADELAHAGEVLAVLRTTPDPAAELLGAWRQNGSGPLQRPGAMNTQ